MLVTNNSENDCFVGWKYFLCENCHKRLWRKASNCLLDHISKPVKPFFTLFTPWIRMQNESFVLRRCRVEIDFGIHWKATKKRRGIARAVARNPSRIFVVLMVVASHGIARNGSDGWPLFRFSTLLPWGWYLPLPLLVANITGRWEVPQSAGRMRTDALVYNFYCKGQTVTTRRLHKQRHWDIEYTGERAYRHQRFPVVSESVRSQPNSTET